MTRSSGESEPNWDEQHPVRSPAIPSTAPYVDDEDEGGAADSWNDERLGGDRFDEADDEFYEDDDEFDDVEDRAADLMARVAAQRFQQQPHDDESVDDDIPAAPTDWQPMPADPATTDFIAPIAAEPATKPLRRITSGPSALPEDEQPGPDVAGRHRAGRRVALPPWQAASAAMPRGFDPRHDAAEADTSGGPPRTEITASPADSAHTPSDAVSPLPPGWVPGVVPAGWQAPMGWLAAMAPPVFQDVGSWMAGPQPGHPAAPEPDHRSLQLTTGSPDRRAGPASSWVAPSLDEAEVFSRGRPTPHSGWQRVVYLLTGGLLNPGPSAKDLEYQQLLEQIRQPIVGDYRIAVLSIKGGVGKTTTTLGLGSALAMVRTDRVIAIDANPDRGTLAERVPDASTSSTVRDLLRDPNIERYADVRSHTRMTMSRLEVLASEQDPAVAEVFGESDYRRTMEILRSFYNVILTDCGTGIMHSAMVGVLELADAIVLVSSPAIDAARSASATLDWLIQHGYGHLVREAQVVLSASRPGAAALKVDKVVEHFEARCGSIHAIPFEPHLAEGADFDFSLLKPATKRAYLELAGAVSEKFAWLQNSDTAVRR